MEKLRACDDEIEELSEAAHSSQQHARSALEEERAELQELARNAKASSNSVVEEQSRQVRYLEQENLTLHSELKQAKKELAAAKANIMSAAITGSSSAAAGGGAIYKWPSASRFVFNFYRHAMPCIIRGTDGSYRTILSREGTAQGCPIAMYAYGVLKGWSRQEIYFIYMKDYLRVSS